MENLNDSYRDEFFLGERIIVTEIRKTPEKTPDVLIKPHIATVIEVREPDRDGNVFRSVDYDERGSIPFKELPPDCPFQPGYSIQRLNPKELQEDFKDTLEIELGLVRKVLKGSNETQKAATLATLKNLTRYLSKEINAQYKEVERLAQETDLTGRAATLATLKNLNEYLQKRQQSVMINNHNNS